MLFPPICRKELFNELLSLGEYYDDGSIETTLQRLAERIVKWHGSAGGSTFDWDGLPIQVGFAVAIRSAAESFAGDLDASAVVGFLRRHWRHMVTTGYVLGTWSNRGRSHLLFTRVEALLETAMETGASESQKFVRDLANQEDLPTGL